MSAAPPRAPEGGTGRWLGTGRWSGLGWSLLPLGAIFAVAAAVALFGSRSPTRLDPVLAWTSPSLERPFGSGEGGVDLLALTAHAELRGMVLAVAVALFGFVVGTPLGAAAAFARGRFERGVARTCDLLQAFPTFLLALVVLSAVRAPTRWHLGIVFALTAWAPFARLALAQSRVLRAAAFIDASIALGQSPVRVFWYHVLPNLLGVVKVQLGSTAASLIVSEAALAFVGFGPHDGVSLGNVLDQGVASMLRAPHVLAVGALSVFVTSASMLVAARAQKR
ncbi:ABC transporter permease [Pendulispora albinea]|uniref:ABC transporter permease subunit n=1 Tax=Pendulispora albinea TaxID=2741071 RepID=A0ABZ2M8L8_9BACT